MAGGKRKAPSPSSASASAHQEQPQGETHAEDADAQWPGTGDARTTGTADGAVKKRSRAGSTTTAASGVDGTLPLPPMFEHLLTLYDAVDRVYAFLVKSKVPRKLVNVTVRTAATARLLYMTLNLSKDSLSI
jgi:hypothetical protein